MTSFSINKRRVLISPLNWGLGHATRLLPIIEALLKEGHECIIAGESPSIDVIKEAFPGLKYETISGFRVKLANSKHQLLKLFIQLPALISSIYRDRITCSTLIHKHNINLTISDNRYGFHNKKVPSIIVTHQTTPKLGRIMHWSKPLVKNILRRWISHFDNCWIPDINTIPNLSGQLSRGIANAKTLRIGILSRLALNSSKQAKPTLEIAPDILVILSGPEPQRSILEKEIIKRYKDAELDVVILQGLPQKESVSKKMGAITFISHCNAFDYQHLLLKSKLIICRSGYSTIMDLFYLNRKAILIPTPGQYEQEYLALHLHSYFHFPIVKQSRITKTSRLNPLDKSDELGLNNYSESFQLPALP